MRSIRWKIINLCVAVILVPLLLLNRYTINTFDTFTRQNLEQHMRENAFISGEQFKAVLSADGRIDKAGMAALNTAINAYSREIQTRIQILTPAGIVLTDSSTNAEINADLPQRHEVAEAMAGRMHARFKMTDDRQYMYYYVARPIKRELSVCGIAYLSRHTSPIVRTVKNITNFHRMIIAATMAAGIILAAILAQTITGRLRKLTAATSAFAKGTSSTIDVKVKGRDEVAELARSISAMEEGIRKTNTYNREFISTVMHELKMPITAIKGAAGLLEHGAVNKESARDKFLSNIRFEAERMARMVLELNELTKLDMEIPHSQKEKVDYCKCVEEIVERFKTTLEGHNPSIKVTLPKVPLYATVIPGRIEQVISNLLSNAIRYTGPDGLIGVAVRETPDKTIETSVSDNGCGISQANLPKIFDRFFTTEPKDRPKDYGSGLGLAIAKTIVESHRGRIRVESSPGQGATFTFTLPAANT